MTAEQLQETLAMNVIRQCAGEADWPAVLAWWFSEDMRPPQAVFPAGATRQVAYSLTMLHATQEGDTSREATC